MHLDHDNVAKVIAMGSIVVAFETRGKTSRICITNLFHIPKMLTNLLYEQVFVKVIEFAILRKQTHCGKYEY